MYIRYLYMLMHVDLFGSYTALVYLHVYRILVWSMTVYLDKFVQFWDLLESYIWYALRHHLSIDMCFVCWLLPLSYSCFG